MRFGSLVAVIALIFPACGSESPTRTQADSGIEGLVTVGPMCPVERIDSPCPDQPVAATIKIVDPSNRLISSVRTGSDGRYRKTLEPGSYLISAQAWSTGSSQPQQATVEAGTFTRVDLRIDSGIR